MDAGGQGLFAWCVWNSERLRSESPRPRTDKGPGVGRKRFNRTYEATATYLPFPWACMGPGHFWGKLLSLRAHGDGVFGVMVFPTSHLHTVTGAAQVKQQVNFPVSSVSSWICPDLYRHNRLVSSVSVNVTFGTLSLFPHISLVSTTRV